MLKCETFVVILLFLIYAVIGQEEDDVKVFTVSTEETEGYQRYISSANYYEFEVETLGMGTKWLGGDMNHLGGGYKVNLLKKALYRYRDERTIILFTDSYDVIFSSSLKDIVTKFKETEANILFGAEHHCWPDKTLEHIYPSVPERQAKYINSGMFIGYAQDIYEILKTPIKNTDDDQLFYTRAYLDQTLREKHNIKLDHKSEIFQNLNGAVSEIKLDYNDVSGEYFITNLEFKTTPYVIHGNGPSKLFLNNFGNYLAGAFVDDKCTNCEKNNLQLNEEHLPTIVLAIFIEKATPFMEEFFDSVLALDYPKEKLSLFLHNNIEYHDKLVNKFIEHFGKEYSSIKTILPGDKINEANARNLAVAYSNEKKCEYLFVVDAEVQLDNAQALREILKYNKLIISPTLIRPGEVWSNFWGALSEQGFYARSHDYMDIAKNNIRGLWNVPFINSCYLVKKAAFSLLSYSDEHLDAEMAMCQNLRKNNIFMYTLNLDHYGHLVNGDNYNTVLTRPDFYMLLSNKADWENRYIHADYMDQLKPNFTFQQPCPDVYWFPIVNDKFCEDLIAIMEGFGKWSDGSSNDNRLKGGYEAVPTRDIHMNQVGLEAIWLKFLLYYVRPLQEAVFTGYFHNPPNSLMNFVVRYKPTEQPYLKPHHDSSTYTINIALNRVGIDYEGGGCKFLRYNCAVTATKMGWMLMHPGRLTHFHEGLRTTNGTRYIMISFVDP